MSLDKMVAACDPGVRDLVRRLATAGFVTTDSGDGVSKPPAGRIFDVPHVVCTTTAARFFAEARRLHSHVPTGWVVQATYDPADGTCVLLALGPALTEPKKPKEPPDAEGRPARRRATRRS